MNKALQLLSLARKGRRIEAGEEPVTACIRTGHARLVIVASDASEHTLRRIKNILAHSKQPYLQVPFSKEDLGAALGRGICALAALTDPALACAFVSALDQPEQYADLLAGLNQRAQRIRKRQKEGKAHKQKRQGRK